MDPFDGINAYVFVSDAHDADVERLRGLPGGAPGVRAVGILNGPYDAIAAVSAESMGQLRQIVLGDIRGGESPRTDTAVALRPYSLKIPMSPDLPPFVAFVRAHLQPGRGKDALQAVEAIPGFVGAVLVAGSFDLLLEFGRDTLDDLSAVLTDRLPGIPGLVSTVTSIAHEVVQLG
jgi:DNA-binding Lrp family transcriptional regulator